MAKPRIPLPSDRERWQQLSAVLGLISVTGRLNDGHPESAFLIGPPSCGKTAMLSRYYLKDDDYDNKHMYFMGSGTTYGLLRVVTELIPKGVTHLAVPELQTVMMRKGDLWSAFQGTMLQLMEEGLSEWIDAGQRFQFRNRPRLGMIAALPVSIFVRNAVAMKETGMLSRGIVLSLHRTFVDIMRARECANYGDFSELAKITCNPPSTINVRISPRTNSAVDRYAADIDPENVHRAARRFGNIVRAIAWAVGEKEATERHVKILRSFEWTWRSSPA